MNQKKERCPDNVAVIQKQAFKVLQVARDLLDMRTNLAAQDVSQDISTHWRATTSLSLSVKNDCDVFKTVKQITLHREAEEKRQDDHTDCLSQIQSDERQLLCLRTY